MMKQIPGGTYLIGTNRPDGFIQDREGPQVQVTLPTFWIAETTVTNQRFAAFVAATNYRTDAARFGWSYVFDYFIDEKIPAERVPGLQSWRAVPGADWQHPEGPQTTIHTRLDHPVVHVSRNDALAYCRWSNKRLPTEAEWEVAAKGGTSYTRYPWGEEFFKDGQHHCNIWQGNFPTSNTQEDGFANTAPVKTFAPNGYGLYQMIGNVWEWCANPRAIPLSDFQTISGQTYWQKYQSCDDQQYAMRGGSFLCHASYCKRYRIAARNGNSAMSTSNNVGFRCVQDKECDDIQTERATS